MTDEKRGVEKSLYEAGEDPEDRWPHEPDEFDPHSLGPGGETAATDGEDRPEVDRETFRAFWGAVIMVNVGMFLVSIGPMLIYFREQTTLGTAMVLGGLGAFGHAYYTYRRYRARDDTEEDSPNGDTSDAAAPIDTDGKANDTDVTGTATEGVGQSPKEGTARQSSEEVDAS